MPKTNKEIMNRKFDELRIIFQKSLNIALDNLKVAIRKNLEAVKNPELSESVI